MLNSYSNPAFYEMSIEGRHRSCWRDIITSAAVNDPDSRLGTYLRVNPDLKPYVPIPQNLLEDERKLATRFRTGSHSLSIELGRFSRTPRPNRLCSCLTSIQTVWHIFKECPLTVHIHQNRFDNLSEVFNDTQLVKLILRITSTLKILI